MPALSKEFLDIQATIECGFTLKHVCDLTRTYSQMHCTDKYSENSSIIWPVWPNGWVFVYKLNGSGFESNCSHLTIHVLLSKVETRFPPVIIIILGTSWIQAIDLLMQFWKQNVPNWIDLV